MQNTDFISEYLLLDISRHKIPTSQLRFDFGVFSSFGFGVNFSNDFVIRLEFLQYYSFFLSIYIYIYI